MAAPSSADPPPLLEVRGLSKTFPGVRALTAVNLTARRGEVHALMGENGAGKSTLIKILTGVHERDSGEILLEGRPIDPRSPQEAQTLGISTVYQEVNLIPHLSVAENICLGRQPARWGFLRWKEIETRARQSLRRLGLDLDVRQSLASYSLAIQQMAAIARSLDLSAKLLILDEPTSSLDAQEVDQLFQVLRQLQAEGLGIIFITHFLNQVYAIADRISILRNGQLVGEFRSSALPRLELIARMLGKSPAETPTVPPPETRPATTRCEPFLEVRGLSRKKTVSQVDLKIGRGEIIGLAGLLGSGRTELARLLFGIDAADAGEVFVDGQPAALRSPRSAIRRQFGFCPEDRKIEGIIPNLSVRENVVLALQSQRGTFRALDPKAQRELADKFIQRLRIATPNAEQPVKLLSGGNQQKAILARWLAARPRFLILDEPNRGVDVGAKFEIESFMQELAGEGMSILFISSEFEELVRNCRHVAVLREGRKVAEIEGELVNEGSIMRAIAGEHD